MPFRIAITDAKMGFTEVFTWRVSPGMEVPNGLPQFNGNRQSPWMIMTAGHD